MVKGIPDGASQEQVRRLLGEPAEIKRPDEVTPPSDVFAGVGSMFRFNDANLEEIWVYRHKVRTRLRYYFGFRNGRVALAWQETVTEARARELKGSSDESA